jgi:hypothetical protein
MPDVYRYRSPSRPLDTVWLPEPVRKSFDIEAWLADTDIRASEGRAQPESWTPDRVYTFGLPVPETFSRQWGLVQVPDSP